MIDFLVYNFCQHRTTDPPSFMSIKNKKVVLEICKVLFGHSEHIVVFTIMFQSVLSTV